MSALEMSVSEVCCQAGDSTDLFNCYMLVTSQKAGGLRKVEKK